jgi:hypothetical protein
MEKKYIHRCFILAFRLWAAISVFFVLINSILYLSRDANVFYSLIQQGPISIIELTLTSVAIVWFSLGASLALLCKQKIRVQYGAIIVCTFIVLCLYTNIFRERTVYGDIGDYITAAHNLAENSPFHHRYLYPPFFATILEPIIPLGTGATVWICWTANLISVALFALLLSTCLTKYGFSSTLSPLLTLLFLVINVPVLRTLGYIQINLHVANLILISLLVYPRLPILSGLALALAVHLKTSPIILALPFLLKRDWHWCTWFVTTLIALAFITIIPHGVQPFFDYFHNVKNIFTGYNITFRESSFDSFFRSSFSVFGLSIANIVWLITIFRIFILSAILFIMSRVIKNSTFLRNMSTVHLVYNAIPVLMIFMLLASPLVWEHHPVFVALPYLLVIKCLRTPFECIFYGLAYFLEYLLPTFDFFPWSFGRLLSPLILLSLIYVASKRTEDGYLWHVLNTQKFSVIP